MRWTSLAPCIAIFVIQGCQPDGGAQPPVAADPAVTRQKAAALEQYVATGSDREAPPSTGLIGKADVQAVDPQGREPLDDAITCLARAIYWEARGEPAASEEAVANVVMNRLGHAGFPDTVCGVVKQGNERGACQFSWWCDGRPDQALHGRPYVAAKEIARRALNGQLEDRTAGALYFHQRGAMPGWAARYQQTATVGKLVFYKPPEVEGH